jgi:hypothetical protein
MLMKLRLGQPVVTQDGPFGELSDVILGPVARRVIHVVVQPRHRHRLSRLVPIALVDGTQEALRVALDKDEIHQLQRVTYSEFVPLGSDVETTDDWDVGTHDVASLPYWSGDFEKALEFDRVDVTYDRIPKGECEIRRTSSVESADGHVVGRVEGLVAHGEDIAAVIVRSGLPGRRRLLLVPLAGIGEVTTDRVVLNLGLDDVHRLPLDPGLEDPAVPVDEPTRPMSALRERSTTAMADVRAALRSRRARR